MKNIYLILKKYSNRTTFDLLKKSAEDRNINVKPIYTEDFDFSTSLVLSKNDSIYRISTDKKSCLVEKFLASIDVISFYKNHIDCIGKLDNVLECTLIHEKLNLPIIPTIYSLPRDKNLLRKYSDKLNKFPIIIKSTGGQHGVGVMKIDSLESLYSISDYLSQEKNDFILREFIDYVEHARLIVLGNKVISSIEYKRVKDDFRSNVGKNLEIINKNFGEKINDIAIKSVNSLGYEFGGVDILIDKEGNPFIAEVNFPCYFPRAQEYTDIDISGQMIDFLINKSKGKIATK